MLFLTKVKVFPRSVSFKVLMVLKGFRDRERLGTKLELRTWAPESSSAQSPQVTCQRLVAERGSAISITALKAMLHEAIFLATFCCETSCKKDFTCNTPVLKTVTATKCCVASCKKK